MKLLNLFYASFIFTTSALAGVTSKTQNTNQEQYQDSFSLDVSDFKQETKISLEESGKKEIRPGEIVNFSSSYSLGMTNYPLPKEIDPTQYTTATRTDDAAAKLSFNNAKDGSIEDNLVEVNSFNPFSIINFKNLNKYNSMSEAKENEEQKGEAKNNAAGISEQVTMESWFIDGNVKKLVLRIIFIAYLSLYWIQPTSSEDNGYLGFTMTVDIDFTTTLTITTFGYYFNLNMSLGSLVRFS